MFAEFNEFRRQQQRQHEAEKCTLEASVKNAESRIQELEFTIQQLRDSNSMRRRRMSEEMAFREELLMNPRFAPRVAISPVQSREELGPAQVSARARTR